MIYKTNKLSLTFTLLLASTATIMMPSCGCGGSKDDAETSTNTASTEAEPAKADPNDPANWIYNQPKKLDEIQQELQNLPQFKGKQIRIFQDLQICGDEITIAIQDPNKPENVDEYVWSAGGWSEPNPMQIVGDGDLNANTVPLQPHHFEMASKAATNYKAAAEKIENWNKEMPRCITFEYDPMEGTSRWLMSYARTDRANFDIAMDSVGNVVEVKKM